MYYKIILEEMMALLNESLLPSPKDKSNGSFYENIEPADSNTEILKIRNYQISIVWDPLKINKDILADNFITNQIKKPILQNWNKIVSLSEKLYNEMLKDREWIEYLYEEHEWVLNKKNFFKEISPNIVVITTDSDKYSGFKLSVVSEILYKVFNKRELYVTFNKNGNIVSKNISFE